jgi:hypothetical protein
MIPMENDPAVARHVKRPAPSHVSGAQWSMGKVSDRRTEMFSAEVG